MLSILTFLVILFLIFVNGITDAANSVATVVGTKVLSYRKACLLSGIFNAIGVILMYQMNPSVTSTISEIAAFPASQTSMMIIMIASLVTILVSLVSAFNGIPASESYGLIFGLLGATMATLGKKQIHFQKVFLILLGICLSLVGTVFITFLIKKLLKTYIQKMSTKQIKLMQIFSCFGMSFAHGAQDGLKFIGLLKLYQSMTNCFWLGKWGIVFLCAILMACGTIIGGKKIIITVGQKLVKLDYSSALISEMSTAITLILGNLFGLPFSTSHVKTISCASIGKELNVSKLKQMIITWFLVLPACFLSAFFVAKWIN